MLTTEEREKLIQMVTKELDNCGIYIGDPESTCLFSSCNEDYEDCFSWQIAMGATKLVLFPPHSNYIVKIPFNCFRMDFCTYENNYYIEHPVPEEEEDTFDYDSQQEILKDMYNDEDYIALKEPFVSAGEAINYFRDAWDYCDTEVALSEYAAEYCLDDIFVPTEWLFDYNGYPIYIQRKCEVESTFEDELQTSYRVSDELKEASKKKLPKSRFTELFGTSWLASALKYYGEEKTQILLQFISDFGLSDLRDENRGILDGRPVLIDYCGFHE